MPRKRGKRWTASGYDRVAKQKKHIGTFDTRREAAQAEAGWKLRSKATGRETCDHFANRWTQNYPRPRESTNLHNQERVKRFAEDFKGVRLSDLDKPMARRWALAHPHCLAAARAMLGDAVRDGLIATNSFAGLRLPGSSGRKDLVALTERELADLADTALDPRMELGDYGREYRAMILFAGYVGIRPGELFALRYDDIVGEHVTIERAYSSLSRKTGPTKSGLPRTVVIPPPAQKALRDVSHHDSGLVFVSPTGKMWTQPSHHRYWSRLRLVANRPKFELYELRHCAASMALDRGASPWQVAHQLGHRDGGELVMKLYGHPNEALMRQQLLAVWDTEIQPLRALGENEGRQTA